MSGHLNARYSDLSDSQILNLVAVSIQILDTAEYCVCLDTREGLQKNKVKCLCENKEKYLGAKTNKWEAQLLDPSNMFFSIE